MCIFNLTTPHTFYKFKELRNILSGSILETYLLSMLQYNEHHLNGRMLSNSQSVPITTDKYKDWVTGSQQQPGILTNWKKYQQNGLFQDNIDHIPPGYIQKRCTCEPQVKVSQNTTYSLNMHKRWEFAKGSEQLTTY